MLLVEDLHKDDDQQGVKQSDVDPCLFILHKGKNKESPVIGLVVNYVDDGIIVGTKKVIKIIKSKISSVFTISDLGPLKKHLGVNYMWKSDDVGKYWEVQMQEFRNDLISDYEKFAETKYVKVYATPGTPGRLLIKNKEGPVKETEYRKMVGKLLWTVKKESPNCANAVRAVHPHLSNPGMEHWDALEELLGSLQVTRIES